jgi:hypothetical protein
MNKREMKWDEKIAERFLKSLNQGLVEHEPNGNVTPDFLLNTKTGVEVRRLNQNYVLPDGSLEGYEKVAASGWKAMERILKEFGPSVDGESWYVFFSVRSPVNWGQCTAYVRKWLAEFKAAEHRHEQTLTFGDTFQLDLMRASKDAGGFFCLRGGGNADWDGAILAEVERNLRLCVAEKESKVARFKHGYGEWWLVFINRIDLGMNLIEYKDFWAELNPPIIHSFDRIFLVDPFNHTNWVEFDLELS